MATVPRVLDTLRVDRVGDEFVVTDRDGAERFRLTSTGYFLLLQMDGRTEAAEVQRRYEAQFGQLLDWGELQDWVGRLLEARVLVLEHRAVQALSYLAEQEVEIRRPRTDRRLEERDDTRRDATSMVEPWFDYAVFLLNDGLIERSVEIFDRMCGADAGNVRIQEIARHLRYLVDQKVLPAGERRDVSWEAFDAALREMLESRQCPRCDEPFSIEVGAMNRCRFCGASFSSYVLDRASEDRRQR